MNFCPNCGTKITDETQGCPNCSSVKENTEFVSPAPEPIREEASSSVYSNNNQSVYKNYSELPEDEKNFSNGLKVLFVAISILIPVAGLIFGIIAAIILMTNRSKDYKSFGLALLILNIIILVFFLFCCVFSGSSLMKNLDIPDDMRENILDYIENARTLSVFLKL